MHGAQGAAASSLRCFTMTPRRCPRLQPDEPMKTAAPFAVFAAIVLGGSVVWARRHLSFRYDLDKAGVGLFV